ncbi:QacE family quaternary ammonium compound efflux SMR transporter [Nocardioides sp. JQ2195]|uniref:DMT family transporter n=1 Tax=Nocardioides sp. JQ2195 TaxID=2592334 RepID=UPI00143E19F0|nr:SMR family transporter [Nocardioides sp. JQ2195]QIX28466.1 QacE family quaternary ammonium compound efflux SMR transporter [Nocardioides sp. JQ2195]
MNRWLLLAGAVTSEVSASLALKGALDQRWFYAVVVAGYLSAFALLAAVLKRGMGLGVAYGIWAAAGVASTALLSALIFDEPLTPVMLIGLGVIIAGVLLVEIGSQHATRQLGSSA